MKIEGHEVGEQCYFRVRCECGNLLRVRRLARFVECARCGATSGMEILRAPYLRQWLRDNRNLSLWKGAV